MLTIGPYTFDNRLVLAPMAGITDRPFRNICRQLGAGLAVSEMITADTSFWGSKKTLSRLNHQGENGVISVQVVGANPEQLAQAAQINVDNGAQIIDINMGCPAKKVCKTAAGSALLKDEALVEKIIKTVVKSVSVPVTLKTRTGWDTHYRNAETIAKIAQDNGIAMIAMHGRTRACRYSGQAEYDTISKVKRAVTIPVLANGDITDPITARDVFQKTGCDAIMIGRGAQGNPWIFREIAHYLEFGEILASPTSNEIADTTLQHVQALHELYGEQHGVRIARKHIAWYSSGLPGCNEFKRMVNKIDSPEYQIQAIQQFFSRQENGEFAA